MSEAHNWLSLVSGPLQNLQVACSAPNHACQRPRASLRDFVIVGFKFPSKKVVQHGRHILKSFKNSKLKPPPKRGRKYIYSSFLIEKFWICESQAQPSPLFVIRWSVKDKWASNWQLFFFRFLENSTILSHYFWDNISLLRATNSKHCKSFSFVQYS